jgi:hypothetical protein
MDTASCHGEHAAASASNARRSGALSFRRVDGQPRNGLAHLLATGELDPQWHPRPSRATFVLVRDLLLNRDASTLYVTGEFDAVDRMPRNGIAAMDPISGALQPWEVHAKGPVDDGVLEDADRRVLYLNGNFTFMCGRSRERIAALAEGGTKALSLNVPGVLYSVIAAWALSPDNQTLYLGGTNLPSPSGPSENGLVAVDLRHNRITRWHPSVRAIDDTSPDNVEAFALSASGRRVFIGGAFNQVDGKPRAALAEVDTHSGAVTPWNPHADWSRIGTVALSPRGSLVYVGPRYPSLTGGMVDVLSTTTGRLVRRLILPKGAIPSVIIPLGHLIALGG